MAENSGFWTTSGAPAGHQQVSYTQAQWSTAAGILAACSGFEGVAPGYLNELACSYISANHVHCDTGGGIVDGKWYINDAVVGIDITSAGAGTIRKDRIVLRCYWAGFTVALALIAGTAVAYPALENTPGTLVDIPLYKAEIDDAGVVTLTDERRWASKTITHRQGGSATVWSTAGTNNYYPISNKIQAGAAAVTISLGSNTASGTITFPQVFSYAPIVLISWDCTPGGALSDTDAMSIYTISPSASQFSYQVNKLLDAGGGGYSLILNWLAIGPI